MALSRLDYVKEFIDYLVEEYENSIWNNLAEEGMSAEEIKDSDEWKYRKAYTTYDSTEYYGNQRIDETIHNFLEQTDIDEDLRINHGVQQIVFVYEDIVYKISSFEVDAAVHYLREELQFRQEEKFIPLFPEYCYLTTYNDCLIYTQERVYPHHHDYDWYKEVEKENGKVPSDWVIRSDNCCAAIMLEYGRDFLEELLESLEDIGYNYDIHNDNWGYDSEGRVRIFDPIYDEEY